MSDILLCRQCSLCKSNRNTTRSFIYLAHGLLYGKSRVLLDQLTILKNSVHQCVETLLIRIHSKLQLYTCQNRDTSRPTIMALSQSRGTCIRKRQLPSCVRYALRQMNQAFHPLARANTPSGCFRLFSSNNPS